MSAACTLLLRLPARPRRACARPRSRPRRRPAATGPQFSMRRAMARSATSWSARPLPPEPCQASP